MSEMPILTDGELVVVDVTSPFDQSTVGSYWASGYYGFLETGDVGRLAPFEGVAIAGHPLETDPDVIEEFDDAHGPVDVRQYYKQ
jgi:hypothetical protein